MDAPSRRQVLAALGSGAGLTASGCLSRTDGSSDNEPTATETDRSPTPTDDGASGSRSSGHDRQPTVYGSHKDPSQVHPYLDGITTGRWLSAGRITRPHRPVVTWIQSVEDRTAPIGFDSKPVRRYVRKTSFDEQSVLVLRTNITNSCDAVGIEDVTVESDRVVVGTVHERIESGRDSCQERSPSDAWPAWSVGIATRLPVEADRPLAVVERDGTTWSNRYRVELERVSDEVVFEEAGGISVGDAAFAEELDPVARTAIRTAIEDGRYETDAVPPALARAIAAHDHVRDGEAFYELDASVPVYRVTRKGRPKEAVPDDASVFDLESADSEAVERIIIDSITNEGIETPHLPPAFRRIHEEHEYVEWRGRYHELTVERVDPGPPYVLRTDPSATPHEGVSSVEYLADGVNHYIDVSDVTEFEGQQREELEAAADGGYETYNLPSLFRDHTQLVGVAGRTYRIRISDVVGTAEGQFDTAPRPS